MNEQPNPTPPDQPAAGQNAGFDVDADGNITGIWFTMKVDHFVEYVDEAIIISPELKRMIDPPATDTPSA